MAQKLVVAIIHLRYVGSLTFTTSELPLAESTTHVCRKQFLRAKCAALEFQYLCRPIDDDAKDIMKRHTGLGFPGALDCLQSHGYRIMCGAMMENLHNIGKARHYEALNLKNCRSLDCGSGLKSRSTVCRLYFRDCSPLFLEARTGRLPTFQPEYTITERAFE